jgi:hypothetical protein
VLVTGILGSEGIVKWLYGILAVIVGSLAVWQTIATFWRGVQLGLIPIGGAFDYRGNNFTFDLFMQLFQWGWVCLFWWDTAKLWRSTKNKSQFQP